MKFLLLTQYYPPESGSASIKMSELAEYLSSEGHDVTVVTGFPNYPYGKIYEGYKMKLYMREKLNGVNVIRTPLYITSKKYSFKHRMVNHVSFMLTSIYGGLISKRPDLIYYYSPPIFLGFSAWVLGSIFKVPVVADINDLWPQAPIALGVVKNRYIKKIAEWFEKFVYNKTTYLFFYSHTMKKSVIARGVPAYKTEIHPLWVSTNVFRSVKNSEVLKLKKEYKFDGKFVVMYAGYIGVPQGLDVMIQTAEKLKKYRDIIFVIIGDGPEKENLIKEAENLKLNNVRFIPFQPREKIPSFLSCADILFAHLDPAPHRLGTIPAKVLSYMSMGKPLIVAAKGETERLISEIRCGIVVEPRNSEEIAKAILDLYHNEDLKNEMGKRGRDYAVKYFDQKKVLSVLEKRLIEIAKEKN